jgi:hypothetical protein
MTPSELDQYAAHLGSTVEIFGVLTDPRVTPRPGSAADRELAEARTLSLGDGIWGEDRVRTAYAAALMSYTAALDAGLAMATVITGGTRTAIPAVVLARSITEVCSQAWWLLEPRVGARGRVEALVPAGEPRVDPRLPRPGRPFLRQEGPHVRPQGISPLR